MGLNVAQKIIKEHLVSGELIAGSEIALKIDQTLTQDATGTLACLEFESMGISRVRTDLSVSYIDHNTLQSGFENADDHLFLQTFASKYGVILSKAGNGICHQVHLERFGIPGATLLGSDSHTPTGGGIGMIAIGAGGIDVACAMAGTPFNLVMPKIVRVELKGALRPWVTAKDIILEVLKRLSVKGGVGKIFEYSGEGVKTLSVPERATITNMGAELGATTSVFPSDNVTRGFLKAQKRDRSWKKIVADDGAEYDEKIVIDLSKIVPLTACPHMPDNVRAVKELEGMKVDQVIVGSCTNSSYKDLMTVASMLKGRKVASGVSFAVAPGSKQVLEQITANGALENIIESGARILEVACGPCIGMGQAPSTNAVSLRTFNRNFEGRSGTPSAKIYLVSPETAVASALQGVITDPRKSGKPVSVKMPSRFMINGSLVIAPSKNPDKVKVIKGPNISPIPKSFPLPKDLRGEVLLKAGDNITTDHICPAG
ncbi:aconitate hydratase, partial [Candidatus Auribacterota bacterium]